VFYEFLREYHKKTHRHNPRASVIANEPVTAVLDGQQRLTSLYVGLRGSYADKKPRIPDKSPKAYPVRELYLNLLKRSDNDDLCYDFAFLADDEHNNDQDHYWFRVGKILEHTNLAGVQKCLQEVKNHLEKTARENGGIYGREKEDFAAETLSKLCQVVHLDHTISYYLEKSDKLDTVLKIFIRVNSAGTPLSHSDLLLSIATEQWDRVDARNEILKTVDDINASWNFNVDKDFILKTCLVLCDLSDIAFKPDNFNSKNMGKIQSEWENIIAALREAAELVSLLGFNRGNITSNNLFIPIAYYIKHIGLPTDFANLTKNDENVKLIKKWFVRAMLKRIFSFSPDGVLRPVREIIRGQDAGTPFPFERIVEHFKGTPRTHEFTDSDIEKLLWLRYGQRDTYAVMSMLSPNLYNQPHVDHIFPKSEFTPDKLRVRGIVDDKQKVFLENFNCIANLQLLEGSDNISKSDKDFKEWFEANLPAEEAKRDYRGRHLIPEGVNLAFENFPEFAEKRKSLIIDRLKEKLQ
jgi:hypothetical protein